MKSYRKELNFHTKTRLAYVNITPQVEAALLESGICEGLCLVNAMNNHGECIHQRRRKRSAPRL